MFHVRCYHCYCTTKHWYFIQQGLVAICPLGFLFVLNCYVARGMFLSDTIYKFILMPYKANSICSIYSILNKSSCFSLDKNLLCYWHSCEYLREFCQLIHASAKLTSAPLWPIWLFFWKKCGLWEQLLLKSLISWLRLKFQFPSTVTKVQCNIKYQDDSTSQTYRGKSLGRLHTHENENRIWTADERAPQRFICSKPQKLQADFTQHA